MELSRVGLTRESEMLTENKSSTNLGPENCWTLQCFHGLGFDLRTLRKLQASCSNCLCFLFSFSVGKRVVKLTRNALTAFDIQNLTSGSTYHQQCSLTSTMEQKKSVPCFWPEHREFSEQRQTGFEERCKRAAIARQRKQGGRLFTSGVRTACGISSHEPH